MASHELVLILDFGSQYTQLIARRVREANVYCEILPCTVPLSTLKGKAPRAIILSGGPSSVYDDGAPTMDPAILDLGLPVLGICYGMQLLAHVGGGHVARADKREYGPAKVRIDSTVGVFGRLEAGSEIDVWMSHGDRIEAMPPGFATMGTSGHSPFCAAGNVDRRIYGLQFHPEVAHTPQGRQILDAFLFDVTGLKGDWSAKSFIEEAVEKVRAKVGDGHAILGLSGGVDSSVAAVLCARALGKNLTCIFIDNGLLRKDEATLVARMYRDSDLGLDVRVVDASHEFLSALNGVTDPEQKRKTIGRVFIDVFEREAKKIQDAKFLVQGTLYPDVIESVSFKGPSAVIKSHHNVGGLPERMHLGLVEPLRELFKDEVRRVGEALGMPHDVLWRHPFPGPGLAVRCLGPLTPERLHVLREADAIFIDELRTSGQYDQVWQAFAVLLPVRSVGVMGDDRTYEEAVALRAVTSTDGMTADWARLPWDVLGRASSRIINEVRGVNRVTYDVSSKPPSTIEWE